MSTPRKITRIAAGAALAVAATGSIVASTPAAQASGRTVHGCPAEAVCVYPNASWNGDHPEPSGIYWSRGPHNLVNQFGYHRVLNNQTFGWKATLNKGYNGGNPVFTLGVDVYVDYYLTPINSISLFP